MSPDFELIRRAYAAFNERDLDGALATMHPDVRWPNVAEGTVLVGHDAVRAYWSNQWRALDPHVEPVGMQRKHDGHVVVSVHQVVHDSAGVLLVDQRVEHVYTLRDGLIGQMDVRGGR
ncbi:MAG: nuclear transport factor 2 family protein [Vicinamibacteria bacterium]